MSEQTAPDHAVELYLNERKHEVASSTLRNHKYHLKRFLEWCEAVCFEDMSQMTGRKIYEYKIWLRNNSEINSVTLSNHLSTFRVFVRFCESIDAVEEGTAEKVMLPDIDPGEIARETVIEPSEADAILDYLDRFEYATCRHALFYLLWHTGLRTGTVHGLDLDDYHSSNHYLEIHHRPDTDTPLKNKSAAEREVNLSADLCIVLDDYIEMRRHDVSDEHGRKPLLTSSQGRLHKSSIQMHVYAATRPCHYSDSCPHNRDIESCEASAYQNASKCPSSVSPHPIRRSAITAHLNDDVPKEITAERMNVGVDVLEKHYDARSESEKRELRRRYLDNV